MPLTGTVAPGGDRQQDDETGRDQEAEVLGATR